MIHRRGALARAATAFGVTGALVTGCAKSTTQASAQAAAGAVTIAVEAPMTGPESAVGKDIANGVQLALSKSAPGGVASHFKVTTIVADDGGSLSKALSVARSLIARRVAAVIGPYDPAVAQAVLPLYRRAQVAVLGLNPAVSLSGAGASVVPSLDRVAAVDAQELVEVQHAQKVAILEDPASAGSVAVASQLHNLLEAAGVAVLPDVAIAPGANPSPYLSFVEAARPDTWFLSMPGSEAAEVSSQLVASHLAAHCLVDLVAGSGPYATRCVASGLPSVSQMPGGSAYNKAYAARFGAAAGIWGAFAYDSALLLFDSARRAGRWDFRALIEQLGRERGLAGVTGDITMNASNGSRVDAPVVVLDAGPSGVGTIDAAWDAYSGYTVSGTSHA
jgi:branched-chain amino acid transport system substrate-binding protein